MTNPANKPAYCFAISISPCRKVSEGGETKERKYIKPPIEAIQLSNGTESRLQKSGFSGGESLLPIKAILKPHSEINRKTKAGVTGGSKKVKQYVQKEIQKPEAERII